MSIIGWLIMIFSVGSTTGFLIWCFSKVFDPDARDRVHSPLDIDPGDSPENKN